MSTNKFVVRQISTGQFVSVKQGTRLTDKVIFDQTKFSTQDEAMVQVIDDERVANIVNDPKSTPKQIANALFF